MSQVEKDQKLIDDNPGLEPYEYLAMGLSETGYQRLLQDHEGKPKQKGRKPKGEAKAQTEDVKETKAPTPEIVTQKAAPVVTEINKATPKVQPYKSAPAAHGMATVRHKTGKVFKMSRAEAQRKEKKGVLTILN